MATFILCTTWEEKPQLLRAQHSQSHLQQMIFCPEWSVLGNVLGQQTFSGHWQFGCPCFLQGNNHQSLYDSCGFSLGVRHWACPRKNRLFTRWQMCFATWSPTQIGSRCLESLELKCMNELSFFFLLCGAWMYSSLSPAWQLLRLSTDSLGFWFMTSDPLCCLLCTLYTCGSYFSDSSWET